MGRVKERRREEKEGDRERRKRQAPRGEEGGKEEGTVGVNKTFLIVP